jgi:hypothetical protein
MVEMINLYRMLAGKPKGIMQLEDLAQIEGYY